MPATTRRIAPRPWLRPRGFTLIELLVVIAIIGLISAVALPVVLPALNERRVSEGARILQASLAGVRDSAIKANAPRGLRLLPDPVFNLLSSNDSTSPTGFASNRFIQIEPAPDYSEGSVDGGISTPTPVVVSIPGNAASYLRVAASESFAQTLSDGSTVNVLNSPTGWQFNIRQGDQIRFNGSGNVYTIVGPVHGLPSANNPERYINYTDLKNETKYFADATSIYGGPLEYLDLVNGIDDDGDGWIDESCDGIDNDGDGIIDPGFNGIDDNNNMIIDDPAEMFIGINGLFSGDEYEVETFVGIHASIPPTNTNYTISRRPVVSPGGAETTLPAGVVIDLTTWNAAAIPLVATAAVPNPAAYLPERSRLPVNPFNGYVDIMLDQTGRVVSPGAGTGTSVANANSPLASLPFYHFWLAEREDVVAPLNGSATTSGFVYPVPNPDYSATTPHVNFLPMPQGTIDSGGNAYAGPYLKGERRLVTLFTKTGQIVSNSIELFNESDTSTPYYAPQSGVKESQ